MLKYRYFVRKALKLTFFMIITLSILSLDYFEFFQPYRYFTWASLFFFLFLTLFSGYYNSRSIKKPFFFNIFLGTLTVKFIVSIAFIIVFFLWFKPTSNLYIIPYFLLFSIFKAFETLILLKYAREPSLDSNER